MKRIIYLWNNRKRYPFLSIQFFRVWAKRVWTAPELARSIVRHWVWSRKGARLDPSAVIGETSIGGSAKNFVVGAESFIGRSSIMLHSFVTVGERVCINDGVTILTGTHDITCSEWSHVKRPVIIEDYAWIATGATLLPGIQIGRGAVVGAGAVVARDVPAYALAVGNPAVVLEQKRNPELDYSPVRFLAVEDAWLGVVRGAAMAGAEMHPGKATEEEGR